MAQFRRDNEVYLPNGNTIFEVVMLSDKDGNTNNTLSADFDMVLVDNS